MSEEQTDQPNCPLCGRLATFIEDDEDMAWYCEECHAAIETIEIE